MKNVFILLFALFLVSAKAQDFEGTVKWKISSEITDPKMKAQMEEAQKKMNDPAAKEEMKMMQEKMNDPEFKKLMESNPQMKQQMEAAMKMMQGGGVNDMMPSGMLIKIKNQNAVMVVQGGMFKMETLYLKDKNASYKIDREGKTYSTIPAHKEDPNNKVEVKVTKTGETTKILDYTCTKNLVEVTTKGHSMQYFVWTTNAIKDFDFKGFSDPKFGNQAMFYDKLEGVPMRTEMQSPQGKMIMEISEIKRQSLPSSDFAIPSDFKEVPIGY